MKIIDLDGKEIIVTDLPIAVLQADDFRHYRVSKPSEYDLYLYKYWEDIYQKLLLLDTEIKSGS
ncbi:hypothetical protein PQ469_03360 [Mucilaginibacter sp. KACC 22773]|uniref:hypothetical protein n=1 Tax=Mucilaginibacter sp. KACC 22773 TaxID=3025671 RepID=UPI002366C7EF|nr:hypothetical protein [Mucilaginibacter sp. KACC 22773]WDF79043.1 hypothetical protein PQ469_03360 [Mucilaginibacter sp. KACC 22773]